MKTEAKGDNIKNIVIITVPKVESSLMLLKNKNNAELQLILKVINRKTITLLGNIFLSTALVLVKIKHH